MITSVFSKSRPINYIIITLLLIICFVLYQFKIIVNELSTYQIAEKISVLLVLIGSLLLTNFITKKNGLSKDNSYTYYLFFLFMILFPEILNNFKLVLANIFILLALRRLISMPSMITPKEKIFDASLWIFAASLINFWCILFILLVFFSIILHVARDYRNWVIPFIALFAIMVLTIMVSLAFAPDFLSSYTHQIYLDLKLNRLTTVFQNMAVAIYIFIALVAFISMIFILQSKLSHLISSYRKVIFAFIIGIAVFVLTPNKQNGYLLYTFVPVAIMFTNFIETIKKLWVKETIITIITLASVVTFILQLL